MSGRSSNRVLVLALGAAFALGGLIGAARTDPPVHAQAGSCGGVGIEVGSSGTRRIWQKDFECPNPCTHAEIQLMNGGGYLACPGPYSGLHWVMDVYGCPGTLPPLAATVGTVRLYRYNTLLDTASLHTTPGGGISIASASSNMPSNLTPTRAVVDIDPLAWPGVNIDVLNLTVECRNQ